MKPITIIGGGLAGLTLGIGLRRRKVPVRIWEAGSYPRHRVCGEFISGRGQEALVRLGLLEEFQRAGARPAHTACFILGSAKSPIRKVAPPALCLSRYTIDALLAELFRAEGGELRENARWEQPGDVEALVRATGRTVRPVENGWRWFGLKIHAREVQLEADLEMHRSPHGYVGLCRLPHGEVNVCALFRARPNTGAAPTPPKDMLRGAAGTSLNLRLANAHFDESSFCAVAGLSLRPQRAADQSECRVGDALTMIPPVTGNGMSMAFEAAELALDPLERYARGDCSWSDARAAVARRCDVVFRTRLLWARWLQRMMLTPCFGGKIASFALNSDRLWRLMFSRTR